MSRQNHELSGCNHSVNISHFNTSQNVHVFIVMQTLILGDRMARENSVTLMLSR